MRPRLLHLGSDPTESKGWPDDAGFNEAEAFTPRIQVGGFGCPPKYAEASMRPRLLHLGSIGMMSIWRYVASRFNEAEAFTPRIRFAQQNVAQDKVMLQ